MRYDFKTIEEKWIKKWKESKIYEVEKTDYQSQKYYSLYSFPYPSGDGLHVGHVEGMVGNDVLARYYRMKGYRSILPMGWDAFGLPAENFAIKTGIHPNEKTNSSIKTFKEQINRMGIGVDWSREIGTHTPEYYKWTQWIFLELFKSGLVEKKLAPVNWCPSCQTVLANEQVVKSNNQNEEEINVCERCATPVEQKYMSQWFFKITDYADRLFSDIDSLDWPEGTKVQQKNWIGKSEGTLVKFDVFNDTNQKITEIEIYTTRIDTIFGCTFLVLAPENKIIEEIIWQIKNREEVIEYINLSKTKNELQRQKQKEKTGVEIEGLFAVNPFDNQAIPIYISDYVLASYGTGAIMAVPAHDERDFEFATKYNLPIKKVILSINEQNNKNSGMLTEYGILTDSAEYSGLHSTEAIKKMQEWLEKNNLGKKETKYKLRDWLVSRQRYWGAPIPIIYSPKAEEMGYGYLPRNKYNILFLHGFRSEGFKGWRIKFVEEMKKLGHNIFCPNLPNNNLPIFEDWMNFIEQEFKFLLNNPDKLILVGHSLGGFLALKIAEKYKIKKIITIAAPCGITKNNTKEKILTMLNSKLGALHSQKLLEFFISAGEIDINKISQNVYDIVVINSKNDYVIPKEDILEIKKKFQDIALLKDFDSYGHFNSDDIPIEFEELPYFITPKGESILPGYFPEKYSNLPIKLPKDVDFKPTGESPLVNSKEFHSNAKCPILDTPAKREVDTMDTFVDSSWYFLRYADPSNSKFPFDFPQFTIKPDTYISQQILEFVKTFTFKFKNYTIVLKNQIAISFLNKYIDDTLVNEIEIDTNADTEDVKKFFDNKDFEILSESNTILIYKHKNLSNLRLKITISNSINTENLIKIFVDSTKIYLDNVDNLKNYCIENNIKEYYNLINSISFNKTNYWLPPDYYLIGAEHTVLHLLYSRFFTKFFYDRGLINFDEPFPKLRHMGLILGPDGRKMSKRWGNVINPTTEADKYGADTIRLYELFMGPFEETKPWNDRAVNGVYRFLCKVFEVSDKVSTDVEDKVAINQQRVINKLIKKVSEDIEKLSFNTSVAKFMETINFLLKEKGVYIETWKNLLKLLAPFAPFAVEELWAKIGGEFSIHTQEWPSYTTKEDTVEMVNIAVQINGKVRGVVSANINSTESEILDVAKENKNISKYLQNDIKKIIYIKGKILSIITD